MASSCSFLSPHLFLSLPTTTTSSSTNNNHIPKYNNNKLITRRDRKRNLTTRLIKAKASNGEAKQGEEEEDSPPAFNPFGFVTDNPSSRTAIQVTESPAEAGNVGQMLYVSTVLP